MIILSVNILLLSPSHELKQIALPIAADNAKSDYFIKKFYNEGLPAFIIKYIINYYPLYNTFVFEQHAKTCSVVSIVYYTNADLKSLINTYAAVKN